MDGPELGVGVEVLLVLVGVHLELEGRQQLRHRGARLPHLFPFRNRAVLEPKPVFLQLVLVFALVSNPWVH